jgi:hypothetical protein
VNEVYDTMHSWQSVLFSSIDVAITVRRVSYSLTACCILHSDFALYDIVLRRPLVKDRISNFLNQAQLHDEFSHTVLHGKIHNAVITPGNGYYDYYYVTIITIEYGHIVTAALP